MKVVGGLKSLHAGAELLYQDYDPNSTQIHFTRDPGSLCGKKNVSDRAPGSLANCMSVYVYAGCVHHPVLRWRANVHVFLNPEEEEEEEEEEETSFCT